jgi:hypothetical protein
MLTSISYGMHLCQSRLRTNKAGQKLALVTCLVKQEHPKGGVIHQRMTISVTVPEEGQNCTSQSQFPLIDSKDTEI